METDKIQQPNEGENANADAETQQIDKTEDLVNLDINQEEKILAQPCESNKTPAKEATPSLSKSDDFFKARTITVLSNQNKRRSVSLHYLLSYWKYV